MDRIFELIGEIGWVAIYGAVVSTIAIFLNWKKLITDKGKLKIIGMIAVDYSNPTGNPYLCFSVVNIGRRQIQASGIAFDIDSSTKKSGVLVLKDLPRQLQEGEEVVIIPNDFEAIANNPERLFVFDSTGKQYNMKKEELKKLYKDYLKHASGSKL